MYQHTASIIGLKGTFNEITEGINEISHSPMEEWTLMNLHPEQVQCRLTKNKGKEKYAIEKLRLTKEISEKRVVWANRWGDKFLDKSFPVYYLVKKWFYITTRQKRLRYLPRHTSKPVGDDVLNWPKCCSRRFPIQNMYLGVVDCLMTVGDRLFNSRILIERVSRTKEVTKLIKYTPFFTDGLINNKIKFDN